MDIGDLSSGSDGVMLHVYMFDEILSQTCIKSF